MKILLITPPFFTNGNKPVRKHGISRGFLPALGIGYLAAVLIQNGHAVKIIDSQAMGYDVDKVIFEIRNYAPAALGVSFLTPQEDSAYKLIRQVKKYFKNIPVIVGGAHPSCFPQMTMDKCKEIDVLVAGEGEYIMLDIISCLEKGGALKDVKGIYYRNASKEVLKTPPDSRLVDLEALPFPARQLYSLASYAPEPFENKCLPSTNLIVSRGCSYAQCTFCYRSGILKRQYRIQSAEKTLEEIRHLVKNFGVKEFIFYDDDLSSNKKWLIQFLSLLKKEKISISWSFRGRSNTVDLDILKQAKEAGCFSVAFGFESGNQDLLDNIKKGITLEQSRCAASLANSLGLEVVGTFMLGLPGETPQKAEKTIEFAIELDCTYAAFIPTHPFLGTELYDQCQKRGEIVEAPYVDGKTRGARYIPKVTYIPSGYKNKEELEKMVANAYRKFYLRPGYFYKHLKKISSFEDVKRYWNGLTFSLGLF
jgi:anaerobic magnesium-protoporphyrin IX monomethyl ester cyclase